MSLEYDDETGQADELPAVEAETLLDLRLRVWAELGRARMPAARIVGMAPGAIVDLDRAPEEPADLYVNGARFGTGRLLLVDGEWAIRIESIEEIEQMSSDGSAQ